MRAAAPRRRTFPLLRVTFRLVALGSALFAASCLTPDFSIPSASGGSGGAPSSGGTGGPSGGAMGGDGATPGVDHCENDILDEESETDLNCGGECEPCDVDRKCAYPSDCTTNNCIAGRCKVPTCQDATQNQGETGTDCGGENCDGCGTGDPCILDRDCESLSCVSGTCQPASCADKKKNNDETDVDCGGTTCDQRCDVKQECKLLSDCAQPPGQDAPTSGCVTDPEQAGRKVCLIDCPDRQGDCNERAADGCETSTETSLLHCGGCGQKCDPPHVSARMCTDGQCKIDASATNKGCETGYADCDGEVDNGCEVNLGTDPEHCGTCETACSSNNGQASCSRGVCAIACDAGFRDCDKDPGSNGCEVDSQTSVENCGGCGVDDPSKVCEPAAAGDEPFCKDGSCGSVNCANEGYPGYGACDGDGVCDDPLTTVSDCGACNNGCAVENGAGSCQSSSGYACAVGSCTQHFADCDGVYENGCEANTQTDKFHCGGCTPGDANPAMGADCQAIADSPTAHVASAACGQGDCEVVCDTGYADCDGDSENGCEVALTNNATSCGGCLPTDPNPGDGENCRTKWPNASLSTCSTGAACQLGCDASFANCNSTSSDGCETNKLTSVSNCGGCNIYCGGDSSQTNVASATCNAGTCAVTCSAGFCPNLSDPERACSATTGTTQNCASCGNSCTGTNPFCDTSGSPVCRQRFPTELVQAVSASITQNGNLTLPSVSGPGNGRMVVVVVASSSAISTATLGGTAMTLAGKTDTFGDGQPGVVAIYYVPDSALGAAGNKVINLANGFFQLFAVAYELRYASQSLPEVAKTWTGTDCSSTAINLQVSAPVTTAGSMVLAGTFAQGSAAASGTPIGSLTETAELFNGNQGTGLHGYRTGLSSNTTVGWGLTGTCWSTGLAVAVVGPLISP